MGRAFSEKNMLVPVVAVGRLEMRETETSGGGLLRLWVGT